ncbi:MAG: cysteine-rich CWC family protein [Burkholderiaceae bacterium]
MDGFSATPSPAAVVDPSQCPLCGEQNRCAMEVERTTGQKQPPCWCTTARFDAALLAQIPAEKRNLACVCAACAASALEKAD